MDARNNATKPKAAMSDDEEEKSARSITNHNRQTAGIDVIDVSWQPFCVAEVICNAIYV